MSMRVKTGTLGIAGLWLGLGVAGLAATLSSACGSEDGVRAHRGPSDGGGAGGDADGSASGETFVPAKGGMGGSAGSAATAGDGPLASGGVAGNGSEDMGGAGAVGGAADSGGAGAVGVGGEGGAACESVEPAALVGRWQTICNGYTCQMNFAEGGLIAAACTNGQYDSGMVTAGGVLALTGSGGGFLDFSNDGTFTRTCDALSLDYTWQAPPHTGAVHTSHCVYTAQPTCLATLRQTLVGTWSTACGASTCDTAFGADGSMLSTCTNGQHSTGTVGVAGDFTTLGSGGNFPDYSTAGAIGFTDCDTFLMSYTYQSPPNQGAKTAAHCTYTRKP